MVSQSIKILISCSLILIFTFVKDIQAEQYVYVSDILYVPLRSGQGNQFRIIDAALKSGTRLALLENDDEGVWSKVKTDSGTEGWIRTQYLLQEETGRIQLNKALSTIARHELEIQEINKKNNDLTQSNKKLTTSLAKMRKSRTQAADELQRITTLSTGAIELDKRYQQLLEEHQITQMERDSLAAENNNLISDQRMSFMIYGAGLLILGMLLTIVLPLLKPKKRFSEWT